MTDDRADADRLSDEYMANKYDYPDQHFAVAEAYFAGYLTACEAKRAEIESWKGKCAGKLIVKAVEELFVERALSAKLIETMLWYAALDIKGNDGEEPCNLGSKARKAVTEYYKSSLVL